MKDDLIIEFEALYKVKPDLYVKAPGRINLIGEHTDYNEGFVLPAAIDRKIEIIAKKRDDNKIKIYAKDYSDRVEFSLDDIKFDENSKWSNYERGVADVLQKKGYKLSGADVLIGGNIPVEAGLSSSAAVEIATILMFNVLNDLNISELEMIKLARKAENEFVGVKCGIMDQFVSLLGKKDSALFIDCKTLDYKYIPFNLKGIKIVISNTKVKRQLVSSEYNKRRKECEDGVKILRAFLPGINSLRDVSVENFEKFKQKLPDTIARRCEHVIFENERVLRSLKVLNDGNFEEFGNLLYASHFSLRDLYEVSCKELDLMVEIAGSVEGVYGSRMMGAGFGGCTITLLEDKAIMELQNKMEKVYFEKTKIKPEIYICSSEEGAGFIKF